jgi:hypothetical protein
MAWTGRASRTLGYKREGPQPDALEPPCSPQTSCERTAKASKALVASPRRARITPSRARIQALFSRSRLTGASNSSWNCARRRLPAPPWLQDDRARSRGVPLPPQTGPRASKACCATSRTVPQSSRAERASQQVSPHSATPSRSPAWIDRAKASRRTGIASNGRSAHTARAVAAGFATARTPVAPTMCGTPHTRPCRRRASRRSATPADATCLPPPAGQLLPRTSPSAGAGHRRRQASSRRPAARSPQTKAMHRRARRARRHLLPRRDRA